MKRNNKKGFTIVELVIVIAVIAILAGVLIPTFSGIVNKAKLNAALQEAKTIMTNYTASIDYTEETPKAEYFICVKKDANTYYQFKVINGKLDDACTEVTTLPNGFVLREDGANGAGTDNWPDMTEVE